MTIWDVLALARRFSLLTVCVAVLAGGAVAMAWMQPTAVSGRVRVAFIAPEVDGVNALTETSSSLVDMAGVVARSVNGLHGVPQTVSVDVNLISQGIPHGFSVRQPAVGGQWETRYEDAVLDVQSSGPTLDAAAAAMAEALVAVESSLSGLEDRESVPADLRIRLELSPSEPVYEVERGSRPRAVIGTAMMALLATLATLLAAKDVADRRDRRRTRQSDTALLQARAPDTSGS